MWHGGCALSPNTVGNAGGSPPVLHRESLNYFNEEIVMSKLMSMLLAAGFAGGMNAAIAQNVHSDKDKAQGQEQTMEKKEGGGASSQGQAGQEKFESGKPQQKEGDRGETGRNDMGKKQYEEGKPQQKESAQQNQQNQSQQR
jgi:hypothetical protein